MSSLKINYDVQLLNNSGLSDGNNQVYKLKLPNMTSWTAHRTIATTDDISTKMDKSNPTGTGSLKVGDTVTASGTNSTAFGTGTTASGAFSLAEGNWTTASGNYSHAEGTATTASGYGSHTEGEGTIAQRFAQHVFGEYNVLDTTGSTTTRGDYVEIVGNGSSSSARSNARTLDWSGNEILAGTSQATGFKTASGTSSQFLKADGSVDSTSYATTNALSTKLSTVPDGTNSFLDSNNKISSSYLPDYILGQLVYGGTVTGAGVATLTTNAKTKIGTSSNSITLTNNTTAITGYSANEGIYYVVSSNGSFASLGLVTGDWLISTGSSWKKIDNTDAVSSINGATGAITNVVKDTTNGSSEQILIHNGTNHTGVWTSLSTAPTSGSSVPITSGAVYTALNSLFTMTNVSVVEID